MTGSMRDTENGCLILPGLNSTRGRHLKSLDVPLETGGCIITLQHGLDSIPRAACMEHTFALRTERCLRRGGLRLVA